MQRQTVQYVATDRKYGIRMIPDHYSFREKSKHHWLQRICLRILDKLGCHHREETIDLRHYNFSKGDAVMEAIHKQCLDYFKEYNTRPECVPMGMSSFHALRGEIEKEYGNSLVFEPSIIDGRPEIRGVQVHIVPWMDGILVVPPTIRAKQKAV